MAGLWTKPAAVAAGALLLLAVVNACAKQPEADLLVAGAQKAMSEVRTLRAETEIGMNIDATGTDTPRSLVMSATGSSEIDVPSGKLHTLLAISLEAPGEGAATLPVEVFGADEWLYVSAPVDGAPFWGKSRQSAGWLDAASQVGQQLSLLETATGLKLLPDERVDGQVYRVLEFTPDVPLLIGQVLRQARTQSSMGLAERDFAGFDFKKVVKTATVRQWIHPESNLLLKAVAVIVLELTPADFDTDTAEFDTMSVEMAMTVLFSDYDQSLDIQVPEAALAAAEIPNMR